MLNSFIIPEICNDHVNTKYQQRFYAGFCPPHLIFTDIIQLPVLKRANWTSFVQIISRTISHLVRRRSGRTSTPRKVWKQVSVGRSKPASCPHIVVTKGFNSCARQAAVTVCHRATKGPNHSDWTATSYLLHLKIIRRRKNTAVRFRGCKRFASPLPQIATVPAKYGSSAANAAGTETAEGKRKMKLPCQRAPGRGWGSSRLRDWTSHCNQRGIAFGESKNEWLGFI